MMPKPIYLDHASTTPVDPRVLKAMLPYFSEIYANPSSIHEGGRKAREKVATARNAVAKILHCLPEEIIFTSGGTESINLAIKSLALPKGNGHIITSTIEHPAVLETCRYLKTKGFVVTYLPVDKYGLISPADVIKSICQDTILISIMYANNEIGTIQPIAEIGKIAKKYKIPFHSDTCQAGMLDLDVRKLNVDLLTLNSSKIYGPKGVGILYVKKGISLEPLHHGGGQEFGLRSGTENVPGIVGFAAALELIQKKRVKENTRLSALRDDFIQQILTTIPHSTLNGHPTRRLPNNINISFAGVEAEAVVHYLSQQGIFVSSGSACSSQEIEISHVLKALGLPEKWTRGSVRFSLGRTTTKKELDIVFIALKEIISSLRRLF